MQRLRSLNVPLVAVDPVGLSSEEVPSIGCTNWAGGFAATEHLLDLGHRRIAVIGGPHEMMCSQERIAGYEAAMGRAGIGVSRSLIRHGDFYVGGGSKAAAALLGLRDRPTAIFAGSDEQARGVYDEAHARGLRIPQDSAVGGFDDTCEASIVTPTLTTVRQPLAEMGRMAVALLVRMLHDQRIEALHVELETKLVVRGSTAPPGVTSK